MVCRRCSYCCHRYIVVIVDDPKKGIKEDNLICHEGNGTPCKHLIGNKPGEYSCAIHDKKWYKKTPCFAHGQIEHSPNDVCRMGEYILKQSKEEQCALMGKKYL